MKKKKESQELTHVIKNNFIMLKKIAKLTPGYFIFTFVNEILWGVESAAYYYFTYNLLNSLDENASFEEMLGIIIIMGIIYLIMYSLTSVYINIVSVLGRRKLFMKLHKELFEKAKSVDIECFDNPEFYNNFVWAMDNAGGESAQILDRVSYIIYSIITSYTVIALIFTIDYIVAICLIIGSIISVIIMLKNNKLYFKKQDERKILDRKRQYFFRVFRLPDYAKEIRTSHISDNLLSELDKNADALVANSNKFGKKFFINNIIQNIITYSCDYGSLIYLAIRLIQGNLLVGAFAASVGMVWTIRWNIYSIVNKMTEFGKSSLFLDKYYAFLNYEVKIKSGSLKLEKFDSIEMDNVSFNYETEKEEKKDALKDVCVSIRKGEKVALVGYNGAGKTTLIKLMLRLYDPNTGVVKINGKDIKEYDIESLRDKIGVVFQDYKVFATSIAENVMNGEYLKDRDEEIVLKALEYADFTKKLEDCKNGLDTMLTREFDEEGVNLSGGEGQKIAIARVFAHPYELIIMDEPSASLDPVSEYELNQSILNYAKDKTVVFISHRLSTTRIADKIYMFDSGRLIEQGTHSQLMEAKGKYAEMFNLQAKKYIAN